MQIISPSIDLIDLIAARGNTSLDSAVSLTKSIRWDIQTLGARLSKAASEEEKLTRASSKAKSKHESDLVIKNIIADVRRLLVRIEDAVPLINLAITTSGANLSSTLPASVSPSRLLQASTFLTAADTRYSLQDSGVVQVGPTFSLSVYMLFLGHSQKAQDEEGLKATTWQEVMHKVQVKLVRVPLHQSRDFPFGEHETPSKPSQVNSNYFPSGTGLSSHANEFAYQIALVEDLDDDRAHAFEDGDARPSQVDDVEMAGIRFSIPIHEVAKIFYADTGKILNIGSDGEANNPVLLIKRDVNAPLPRGRMDSANDQGRHSTQPSQRAATAAEDKDQSQGKYHGQRNLPPGLDPEWIALEVFTEDQDSEEGSDGSESDEANSTSGLQQDSSQNRGAATGLLSVLSGLSIRSTPATSLSLSEDSSSTATGRQVARSTSIPTSSLLKFKTSLSLLEMLIRLTSLQQFQQTSHLAITDELLNFFLEESSTSGAASGDVEARKRIRMEARFRVGFDPYDESPVKRRGEAYQRQDSHPRTSGEENDYRRGYDDAWTDFSSSRQGTMSPERGPSRSLPTHHRESLSSPLQKVASHPRDTNRRAMTDEYLSTPLSSYKDQRTLRVGLCKPGDESSPLRHESGG